MGTFCGKEEAKWQLTKCDHMLTAQNLSTHLSAKSLSMLFPVLPIYISPYLCEEGFASILVSQMGTQKGRTSVTCPMPLSREGEKAGLGSRLV